MARIRGLKIGFFQNEELASLSMGHRMLFAGLWVLADREGRLENRPKRIKAQLFPYDDVNVAQWLADLTRAGFIAPYVVEGQHCLQVLNFAKHQHPHPKEAPSMLPPWTATAEPGKATAEQRLSTAEPLKGHDEPGGSGSGSWDLDLGSGNGHGSQSPRGAREAFSRAFLEFWNLYPKKVRKEAAWAAWQRMGPDIATVIAALGWQVNSDDWNRDNGRYRPSPDAYLSERRWQDEPPMPATYVPTSDTRTGRTMLGARNIAKRNEPPINPFTGLKITDGKS